MSEQERTGWQIACEWYNVDEIESCIKSSVTQPAVDSHRHVIPRDIFSREFAEWLTEQYRLAMAKGIQFGRELGKVESRTPYY